jgi:hypothetical protein
MPDETRVFDVTKPKHVSPSATSKPVIVGHHPMANDPMVRGDDDSNAPLSMRIPISGTDGTSETHNPGHGLHDSTEQAPAAIFSEPESGHQAINNPALAHDTDPQQSYDNFSDMQAKFTPAAEMMSHPDEPKPNDTSAQFSNDPFPPSSEAEQPPHIAGQADDHHSGAHIEELHFSHPKPKRTGLKVTVLVLLALLIGGYLAIDSGLIKTSIKLPIHVFKQKSSPSPKPTPVTAVNQSTAPSIPDGFKKYNLAGTAVTFAASVAWGSPTSVTEGGYSKRGGSNQSDGTYAYLVSFATNKDVQIAVTSSKYLPATRDTLYYDYLQWCTGTNDGKLYESVLHYSTSADKIDTPSTITCDQGPVPNGTKIDDTTIVQNKAVDKAAKVIGDIYTKNLTDPSLVVLRVKDTAMTNTDSIKQLLNTVTVGQSASGSTR